MPTRTVDFDLESGQSITLTLRKLGIMEQVDVSTEVEALIERLVPGKADDGQERSIDRLNLGDGELIEVTETMCRNAVTLAAMQTGPDRLTVEDWIAFQAVESAKDCVRIMTFASAVNSIGRPTDPKASDVPRRFRGGSEFALRSVLEKHRQHPEITSRLDALLCSINDRLGGGPGQDIAPLTEAWMQELAWLYLIEVDSQQRARDRHDRQRRRGRGGASTAFAFDDDE